MIIIESNLLMLTQHGTGVSIESQINNGNDTIGLDLYGYFQNPYAQNGVNAYKHIFQPNLKYRHYFDSKDLYGFFLTAQTKIDYIKYLIKDASISSDLKKFYFIPSADFGYRFIFNKNITVASFVGVGLSLPKQEYSKENLPDEKKADSDWNKAADSLDYGPKKFIPVYGISVGVMF